MNTPRSIALILPINQSDYLANTVIDGLLTLSKTNPGLSFKITKDYLSPFDLQSRVLPEREFMEFAIKADLILLVRGKRNTNVRLAQRINLWKKTVFIDGSEFGKDGRYDFDLQKKVLSGTYDGFGTIDKTMLEKCALYFRREKPYIPGIIPLPFGIESRYVKFAPQETKKEIDFVCIFGQDEYPIMRRYAAEILENFCKKNNFTYATGRTKGFNFVDETKQAGRDEFFKLLSRAKVGISIGGGGFDTARFWEILGNDCILLTEKIDIYEPDGDELNYKRIFEFNNLFDFEYQLNILGKHIKTKYDSNDMSAEYQAIMERHSSSSRVLLILEKAKEKGILP